MEAWLSRGHRSSFYHAHGAHRELCRTYSEFVGVK